MAEFDDKLNSILSNPDAMAQIMQLAQSIGGGDGPPAQTPPAQQTPPAARSGDLFSSLAGGLDPKLLLRLMPLIQVPISQFYGRKGFSSWRPGADRSARERLSAGRQPPNWGQSTA